MFLHLGRHFPLFLVPKLCRCHFLLGTRKLMCLLSCDIPIYMSEPLLGLCIVSNSRYCLLPADDTLSYDIIDLDELYFKVSPMLLLRLSTAVIWKLHRIFDCISNSVSSRKTLIGVICRLRVQCYILSFPYDSIIVTVQ